jgi:predicted nuclease of predicted toxin-antitoxin system
VKIKLDENLPERLVPVLTAFGYDRDTVRTERLNGQADPIVWTATQAGQRFFVTQDLDDVIVAARGFEPAFAKASARRASDPSVPNPVQRNC